MLGEPSAFSAALASLLAAEGWAARPSPPRWTHEAGFAAQVVSGQRVSITRGGARIDELRSRKSPALAARDVAGQIAAVVSRILASEQAASDAP